MAVHHIIHVYRDNIFHIALIIKNLKTIIIISYIATLFIPLNAEFADGTTTNAEKRDTVTNIT